MKDYKTIWDSLSATFADASFVVGYLGDEEEIRSNGQHTANFLKSVLRIEPTDKVLEIGCGVARIGRELAPACGEWHGADISGKMIEYSRERTTGMPNVFLHELPETDLSIFNDGYFDCVYSTIVFMHLDKIEVFNYMREALRVLAPGGRAYFDTYNIVAPEAWQEFLKIIEAFPLGRRPGHVSQFSSPPEILKFMTEAGYTDVHVDDVNPQLVVTLGRRPAQEGFVRPTTALNQEVVDRLAAWKRQQEAEAGGEIGVTQAKTTAVVPYADWIALNEDIAAKDSYIVEVERVLEEKNRHIATLEKRVRQQDRLLGQLPVRVAARLSKPRR
ncbi:MAG TPA: methyltransferase domain-containing protein [Chloroflexia bacterium]|nr:methyltransferase domain-containing protein [Chloroflexia bacterium]